MAVQIQRDSFGRATLMRERAEPGQTCAWCGQPARFAYYWEPDSLRFVRRGTLPSFCSVDCYRTYR